jgi:sec-independent protein translocase protein TatB
VLDFGISELLVIGVVALIVIGPERLPRVARTAGHLLGRFQRYVSDVKADINREIELSELKDLKSSVEDAARSIEQGVKASMDEAGKEFQDAQTMLESAGSDLKSAGEDLKKTGDEIQQAMAELPMPHMGTAPGLPSEQNAPGSAPAAPEGTGGPAAYPLPAEREAPIPTSAGSSSEEDSTPPQLELGLDTDIQAPVRKQA